MIPQHTLGKPVNVTIQRQEQKTVLGASRTVTYGNDSLRHKEWDKATGVFVGSSEHLKNVTNKAGWYIENLTVTIQAIATNMWSPEIILEPNPDSVLRVGCRTCSAGSFGIVFSICCCTKKEAQSMKKAAFACTLILITIIVSVLAAVSSALAYAEPSTGVKKGDWIEYAISITGPPLDPLRNLTWYRTEILEVDGASFRANKTALTVNGTFSSSIWNFNLTEGQVQGWVIIPANLSTGDAFFDAAKSANITIEGEEQKTLLGASRTVTHASDPGKVYKEWDKVTGVYVHAIEHTTNYTVITNAIATNMWSPQILEPNQTEFYAWLQ